MNTSVICGLHRSGTTYVGKILSLADSCYVIHEPFNPVWGLDIAPPTYTYWTHNAPTCDQTIRKALSFHGNFSKPTYKMSKITKTYFRIFGGKQHLQWNYLKIRSFIHFLPMNVIWKDPFCTFMAQYLLKFWNMKMVCMIRHPCAHYYSVSKQNWNFDINHLIKQKELLRDYGDGISDYWWNKAKTDNLVSIALLWKIMIKMINSINKINVNLLVIRHEDLCESPEAEVKRICQHFGIKYNRRMQQYINKTTNATAVEASSGKVHGFSRDSKALVNIWKKNLDLEKQDRILQTIGNDIQRVNYEK